MSGTSAWWFVGVLGVAIGSGVQAQQIRLSPKDSAALVQLAVVLPPKLDTLIRPIRASFWTPGGFQRFESDFVREEAVRWAADGDGCRPGQRYDYTNYYDRAWGLYQMWARTGKQIYRDHADQIAICYRDHYLAANNYKAQPHNVQLEGLAAHYLLTGDTLSRKAVIESAKFMIFLTPPERLTSENYPYFEARIQARDIIGCLLAGFLGDTSKDWGAIADQLVTRTAALQRADGSYAFPTFKMQQSNYMVGLLNDAFAKYYRLRKADPAILSAVKRSVDYLWSTQWKGRGFLYTNDPTSNVASDLSGLIVTGFGFVAFATGDLEYQMRGDQIFTASINGAYYAGQKQFNQQYYNTSQYLGYRR